jgi:uncharacterized Zn finger protein (UPF0148 family)
MNRIGTLKGVFLTPGVSKNGRIYTPGNIKGAVNHMSGRLSGGQVIPMHTSHKANAEGDTRATAATVTKVYQDDAGAGHFEADIIPTDAGRDVAAMAVPDKSGKAALKTVSIFGSWLGDVSTDEAGNETAPDLDVTALDFTHRPGMPGAQIDTAKLGEMAALSGATICESLDSVVLELDETPSVLALLEAEIRHPMVDGLCTVCHTEDAKAPYGDVTYADPGYQKDKKKRYPLDTKAHARAAWSYINKAKNAAKYTDAQLSRIKSKIKAACKRFGIDIAKESVELGEMLQRMGAEFADVIEAYASTTLDNGAASIYVWGYINDPSDLPKAGAAMARAALAGLLSLDPDNDGDIDALKEPGGEDDDDMECAECGFEAVPQGSLFCPQCGQPVPGAEEAPAEERKGQMANHSAEQVKALLTPEQAASLDPAKTTYTTEELQALLRPPITETKPVLTREAVLEALVGAPAAAPVESELDKARRLVAEADAAAKATPVTLADLAKFAEEMKTAAKAEVIEEARRSGTIVRRGIVGKAEAMKDVIVETDARKLAGQTTEEFKETLFHALDPMLPQGALV